MNERTHDDLELQGGLSPNLLWAGVMNERSDGQQRNVG